MLVKSTFISPPPPPTPFTTPPPSVPPSVFVRSNVPPFGPKVIVRPIVRLLALPLVVSLSVPPSMIKGALADAPMIDEAAALLPMLTLWGDAPSGIASTVPPDTVSPANELLVSPSCRLPGPVFLSRPAPTMVLLTLNLSEALATSMVTFPAQWLFRIVAQCRGCKCS